MTERDSESIYPLLTYNDRTGEYDITMPVNIRIDLTDTDYDLTAVQAPIDVHTGWTQLVATVGKYWPTRDAKPAEVWDSDTQQLISPVGNYRKPSDPLGPQLGFHLYLWPVRFEGDLVGVAGQAHTDIGTVTDHIGSRFDRAAELVSAAYAAAGWRITSTEFEYGISEGYLDFWGATGDRVIRPPKS
ncbi:hypothetical protein [Haloarcula nitratireducens]|uniref:Uncharacterized protein n=1 Tax=Haloarcula nitratireducens TaxID=2487749 RepID=A0AAW4P9E4_9EURY|nr:hypothetical protein [Halomicroarcula nitratireducens]MBX0293907.1 hypothetical protein [Halomicroarcula nitratireducens]